MAHALTDGLDLFAERVYAIVDRYWPAPAVENAHSVEIEVQTA